MEAYFNWKTRLFSNRYEIYRNEILTGNLVKTNWSRKVRGELNGKEFLFETKGFFKQQTTITDLKTSTSAGAITFNSWRSKATIFHGEKEYSWKYDNFWRTKWNLGGRNGAIVLYHARGFKGDITARTEEEVLVLAGFFVRNYFTDRASHAAAASS